MGRRVDDLSLRRTGDSNHVSKRLCIVSCLLGIWDEQYGVLASERTAKIGCATLPPPPFFVNIADKGLSSSGDPGKTGRFLLLEALQVCLRASPFAELAELSGLVAEDLEATFEVVLDEFEFLR